MIRGTDAIDMRAWSPRAAAEFRITDALMLNASWGRYVQMPAGTQVSGGFGNPQLDFTVAEHRVIGMRYAFAPLWSVPIEAYQKPMHKLSLQVDAAPPDN